MNEPLPGESHEDFIKRSYWIMDTMTDPEVDALECAEQIRVQFKNQLK